MTEKFEQKEILLFKREGRLPVGGKLRVDEIIRVDNPEGDSEGGYFKFTRKETIWGERNYYEYFGIFQYSEKP